MVGLSVLLVVLSLPCVISSARHNMLLAVIATVALFWLCTMALKLAGRNRSKCIHCIALQALTNTLLTVFALEHAALS